MISQEENQLLTDLHKLMTLAFYFHFLVDPIQLFQLRSVTKRAIWSQYPTGHVLSSQTQLWVADGNHGVICSTTLGVFDLLGLCGGRKQQSSGGSPGMLKYPKSLRCTIVADRHKCK